LRANTCRLVAENDLTPTEREKIRALLIAAFPKYANLWTAADSWGGPLEYRLLLRDRTGRLIGHLGLARRMIDVGGDYHLIAGIGTVAILPDMQGQGSGKYLLRELETILRDEIPVEFGFLQCRDAVIAFYEKAGFSRIPQSVRSFNPNQRRWQTDDVAAMILPAMAEAGSWPTDGIVDLMGMPW
jgi:GNAT superfamily N-acetyltransferase